MYYKCMTYLVLPILLITLCVRALGLNLQPGFDHTPIFLAPDTLQDEKLIDGMANRILDKNAEEEIQLSGFIIDDTKSKFGRDFYEFFYTNWSFPSGISLVDILIKESPPMFSTTVITIQVGETDMLSFKLSPRVGAMEEYADAAIAEVQNYLIRLAEIEQYENFNSAGIETF